MKIYILTCISETGDVVDVQPFVNRDLALATRDAQYRDTRGEFEENETLDPEHDFLFDSIACAGSERNYYYWYIFEREL